MEVSSDAIGGTRGPIDTFGYPCSPTKKPGGDAPKNSVFEKVL
jgi:hypothetical protein